MIVIAMFNIRKEKKLSIYVVLNHGQIVYNI